MSITRRNTLQKKLVLNSVKILKNHPTADEVYCSIVESYPKISKATVYRNLNHLSDDGYLLKLKVPGAADRYDGDTLQHYHAVCKKCNGFIDLQFTDPIEIDLSKPTLKANEIDDYLILFSGICHICREN